MNRTSKGWEHFTNLPLGKGALRSYYAAVAAEKRKRREAEGPEPVAPGKAVQDLLEAQTEGAGSIGPMREDSIAFGDYQRRSEEQRLRRVKPLTEEECARYRAEGWR